MKAEKEKMTNRKLINLLLPVAKKYAQSYLTMELPKRDYYGHPCAEFRERVGERYILIRVEDRHGKRVLSVSTMLTGKYDYAAISHDERGWYYQKEFTGLGNGYYATIDENGKILEAEWD